MVYLANAFSLNMLPTPHLPCYLKVQRLTVEQVLELLPTAKSVVGHVQTAALFSEALGQEIQCRRETVALLVGDRVVVGQYRGPRLPEGVMELPQGAAIEWQSVEVC